MILRNKEELIMFCTDKEKTADEMFENLGYRKVQDDQYWVDYIRRNENITFNLTNKFMEATRKYKDSFMDKRLTIEELQAINKKCKEMNWLGDE